MPLATAVLAVPHRHRHVVAQALLIPLLRRARRPNLGPRDLPVVVAGPAPAADALAAQLPAGRVPDHPGAGRGRGRRAAARSRGLRGVRDRPDRPGRAHRERRQPDRRPTRRPGRGPDEGASHRRRTRPPDDPRGAGFASGFLPLALTALAAGAALALLVRGRWARFTGVLVFGALAGAVGPLVLQQWLGVLTGDYLLDAAASGCSRRRRRHRDRARRDAGRPGIGLAVLTVFLVGNPLSGVSAAPELLPQPWGTLGQFCRSGPVVHCCAQRRSSMAPAARARPGCSPRTPSPGSCSPSPVVSAPAGRLPSRSRRNACRLRSERQPLTRILSYADNR